MDATLLRDAYLGCMRPSWLKVKVALAQKQVTLGGIAKRIGRSKALVSLILSGKHKGYEHRTAIARALGLAESVVFPNGSKRRERNKRRAA